MLLLWLFLFFIYIFVPLRTGQRVASIYGAIHIQWANAIRAHCIDTHRAGAVMKGLVSDWEVLLGDAPCLWPNAIYVMKWIMEIDLLVKSADVAKLFPF